jgi:hypothetical protein
MSSIPKNSPPELEQDSETKSSKENKFVGLFLASILLVILAFPCLAPCLGTILPLLAGCQDVIPYRRDVDIAPLMDLDIPTDLDLSQWTNSEASSQHIGSSGVFINAERFPSVADAYQEFRSECDSWGSPAKYGGQGDYQYCISAIRTLRDDPEGLCVSQGRYSSYVFIQKSDVIFEIYEETVDKDSTKKDTAIKQIALEISQAINR